MSKIKKVDPKVVAKEAVMKIVVEALQAAGLGVVSGDEYGMTKGTVVVSHETCDVQLKPVAPKAGVSRYQIVEEEEA